MSYGKKIKYDETKICKVCGRELPIGEIKHSVCKDCYNKSIRDKKAKERREKDIAEYLENDSMHIKRKYKKINAVRILRKKDSGIDFVARDERFVRLLYYKDAWISNYSRCIVYEDGKYKLLRGSIDKATGERKYTLRKEKYIKSLGIFKYKKRDVLASELVVETFVVNYDMMNNTKLWHLNNDVNDGYYKHLYPVTEKQYDKLTELQSASSVPLKEEEIMQVINAVEYKHDGWDPARYRRGLCGVGYSGMDLGVGGYFEISYIKWKNMMQRCYDKKVHKYKPEYADKTVCEEWQNYANFKIWFDEHYIPSDSQIDLDKDLLIQGNKVYSPETCVLLEHYINAIFEYNAIDQVHKNEDGMFVIGKGKCKSKKKVYATYEEAYERVCEKKEHRIEKAVEKNLTKVPMCAYEAMLRWDVRATMCG